MERVTGQIAYFCWPSLITSQSREKTPTVHLLESSVFGWLYHLIFLNVSSILIIVVLSILQDGSSPSALSVKLLYLWPKFQTNYYVPCVLVFTHSVNIIFGITSTVCYVHTEFTPVTKPRYCILTPHLYLNCERNASFLCYNIMNSLLYWHHLNQWSPPLFLEIYRPEEFSFKA